MQVTVLIFGMAFNALVVAAVHLFLLPSVFGLHIRTTGAFAALRRNASPFQPVMKPHAGIAAVPIACVIRFTYQAILVRFLAGKAVATP